MKVTQDYRLMYGWKTYNMNIYSEVVVSKSTYAIIIESSQIDGQIDRQLARYIDSQTHEQLGRQIDRSIDRYTINTYIHIYSQKRKDKKGLNQIRVGQIRLDQISADRHANRQTDKQTDRQIDRSIDRWIDRQDRIGQDRMG